MVDLLIRLVRWVLSLFGAPALDAAEKDRRRLQAVRGLDELEGAEHVHVHGTGPNAKVLRREDGADLVEDGGTSLWVDTTHKRIPREQWRDVWGPLGGREKVVDFIVHEQLFNEKQLGDPLAGEAELRSFGYASVGQFFAVRTTILKHFASPTGPLLDDCVLQSQEYMSYVMQAGRRRYELQREATLNAQPGLLAPIEGITLEVYAKLAAFSASSPSPDQLARKLAEHGLDVPAFHRVNQAWSDRMSKDTTGSIATKYGEAFMQQGQGQYGAAGQAAAAQGWAGGAATGPEPIPYEKMCEIAGALSAWGKTGQDVNTLLHQRFGLSALDYSNVSNWWMTQLMADSRRFADYNARLEQWEQHYKGPVVRRDQDIQF